jgi:hypothetical protein
MGIMIVPGEMTLDCDEAKDIFCHGYQTYKWQDDGFVGAHKQAMADGWLERQSGSRGRLWICPGCSGKKV